VAGWLRDVDSTSVITTDAQAPNTTTQSTKGITPSRMVTPTDPQAHRPGAIPSDASEDGGAPSPADPARADGPPTTAAESTAATPVPTTGDGAGAPPVGNAVGAPPAAEPSPPSRKRRAGPIILGVLAFMSVAFLVGATFVPLPYYLFKPGAVRDTEPLIEVEGTEVYPSEGSISYTTVSLRQATLLGLAQGWLDDDIDIIDRDRVLGGRDVEENRELNLQAMTSSKQVATQVALERLGYDVDVTVGQLVREVDQGFPAEGALEMGDIIVAIDGEPFDDEQDLSRLLRDEEPGDEVTVSLRSAGGSERDVELALAASPDDRDKAVMGVRVAPVVLEYELPFEVTIDTGDVGGPSAGLAFTLGLIDDLTPGDLTGGTDIAVTGTIAGDGTVGPVGGTGQKAAAARDAGISLFLVPSDDYGAAVARAGDDLEVVAVDTVDQALEVLRERGGNIDDLPPAGESAAAHTG
jgi:PDZ domain-containing protein